MASIPKGIDTLNAATQKGAVIKALVAKHGATNVQMAGGRSLRFDLPAGTKTGLGDAVNRVKLTAREDGTVDVRLIEVREVELVGGVSPDNVAQTLAAFLGMEV